MDGGFTGNQLYPEADKSGWYLVEGFCFRGRDLDRCAMQIRVKSDPVFQGVVLYDIVGVDFDGVMGGKAAG
jgi:hypothetical protein